jgi:putative endonuclease
MHFLLRLTKFLQPNKLLFGLFGRSSISEDTADASLEIGPRGEKVAAVYLKSLGYRIITTGFTVRQGEIDIIAVDKRTVVFVEVKAWSRAGEGGPSDAVDIRKQKRITSAALQYLKQHRLLQTPARFDVVQIVFGSESDQPDIRHFKNAFEATGEYQFFS